MTTHAETAQWLVNNYERELIELTKAYGGGWAGLAKASPVVNAGLVSRIADALARASMTVSPPLGLAPQASPQPLTFVAPQEDFAPVALKPTAPPKRNLSFQKRQAPPRDELQTLINEGYSISKLTTHYRAKPNVIKRWFEERGINYVPPAQVSRTAPATEKQVIDEASAIGIYDTGHPDPTMELR